MMHKYSIGQLVYFEGSFQINAARGEYKIVSLVPIEKTTRSFTDSSIRRKHSSALPSNIS